MSDRPTTEVQASLATARSQMNGARSDRWYARTPDAIRDLLRQTRSGPPPAPEIAGVFYRGQTHGLVGKRDAGKSLFMALVARDLLNGGGSVLWIDHEQGARRVLRRMDEFGTDEDALAERFYLVDQARELPPRAAVDAFAGVDLVVLDALTGQISSSGLNDNHAVDIDLVYDAICKPLAHAHGATFVSIDHVPHGEGDRPLGSQRKSSAPDVELIFKCIGRFKPGDGGRARIVIGRDRDGAIVPCEFALEPGPGMEWRIESAEASTTADGGFRPTVLMEKLSEYLEAQVHAVSRRDVEGNVSGANQWKRQALGVLIAEGYVTVEPGPRKSMLCTSARPFRANDDPTAPDCAASAPRRTLYVSAPLRLSPTRGGALGALLQRPVGELSAPDPIEPPDPAELYDFEHDDPNGEHDPVEVLP